MACKRTRTFEFNWRVLMSINTFYYVDTALQTFNSQTHRCISFLSQFCDRFYFLFSVDGSNTRAKIDAIMRQLDLSEKKGFSGLFRDLNSSASIKALLWFNFLGNAFSMNLSGLNWKRVFFVSLLLLFFCVFGRRSKWVQETLSDRENAMNNERKRLKMRGGLMNA